MMYVFVFVFVFIFGPFDLANTYLILVANATNGVSVKIFKWEEFLDNERKISHTVFNFTHSVYFYTQCVILPTVCN